MLPHSVTSFEVQKYYHNKPKFNGVYLRNLTNLLKIKDGTQVINLEEFKSIGPHGIALNVNGNNRRASDNTIYFDGFGTEHIPKEIKKFIEKNHNKYL